METIRSQAASFCGGWSRVGPDPDITRSCRLAIAIGGDAHADFPAGIRVDEGQWPVAVLQMGVPPLHQREENREQILLASINVPKTPPAVVAQRIVDALEDGAVEVLTDDVTVQAKAALSGPVENLTFALSR